MSTSQILMRPARGPADGHSPVRPLAEAAPTAGPGAEIGGYLLQERLGVGGFGEVWRAIGPGGFPKALKVLFGGLSGPQAETELKALNRMRDLRHPFLLSVERVEAIAGRVIVVMELADRSLEQRFREAVSAGQRGVPREELLGYLRDAADALDFMSEQHGLQHLDIKPENLLLQGSHAKVGDFGLTKSLAGGNASLINGFTPLFAPPELFDGRADRASDQYSLAVVYQAMLTGTPPFNGRTAAQLTSQHLKSPPDLTPLHSSDRAVIARALSKNPRTRFQSCRQFVDELSRRRFSASAPSRAARSAVVEPNRENNLTQVVDPASVGRSESRVVPTAKPLRPLPVSDTAVAIRPTVYIGLGGLGCQAVEVLQSRLHEIHPQAMLPALQFVCIDSDADALNALKRRTSEAAQAKQTAWSGLQSVVIPLKSSHEYRKASGDHLNWLSRRWLFNIPRSGRVEGMRPLGRLAFIDNLNNVREAIRRAIQAATKSDNTAKMQNELRQDVKSGAVDIVLIGAICGGTSSGGLLDLGWLARAVVQEQRCPDVNISAFLLHGTAHGRQHADMQDANTICFLRELRQLCLPGVQRPDAAVIGGTTDSTRPFDGAWLLHLGEELSPMEFRESLSSVCDYLELRTFSPARTAMNAWHEEELSGQTDDSELALRTFGIARVNENAWSMAQSEACRLAASVIRRWQQQSEARVVPDSQSNLAGELAELITSLSLSSEAVVGLVAKMLRGDRTKRIDEYAASICARLQSGERAGNPAEWIATLIAQDMQIRPVPQLSVGAVIDDVRLELTAASSRAISRVEQLLRLVLDGRGRLAAAEFAITQLIRSTDHAYEAAASQTAALQQAFSELCDPDNDLFRAAATDPSALRSFARQYAMLLTCQAVSQCINLHVKSLREQLVRTRSEKLVSLKSRLSALSETVTAGTQSGTQIPEQLTAAFDELLATTARFRLSALQHQDASPANVSALQTDAANFLLQTVGATSARTVSGADNSSEGTNFPATARPFLRNVGGGQRVMAVAPCGTPLEVWTAQLTGEFGQCVAITTMPRADISVFCEHEGIAISTVVDAISHLKPRVVELSERVHSRQDIPW